MSAATEATAATEAWDDLEAEYFAVRDERVERGALLELARRAHAARTREAQSSEYELRRAMARVETTRRELEEATSLLEMATKLYAAERG